MTAPTWQAATAAGRGRSRPVLLDRPGFLGPLMLLPAVIYIFALVGIPLVLAVAYSLSDVTVGDQSINWVGFDNFRGDLARPNIPDRPCGTRSASRSSRR